ncbi:MAG: diacylglycerol kinase family protein [Anaerolineaceae bacterium]|jgi:YegS/Rv2252/BmrU family lipid kinase
MPSYKIILNPISGRGTGARLSPLIASYLHNHQVDFDLVHTESPWHAAELTREAIAQNFDYIVAAGGDGTTNEVINGFMMAREAGIQHKSAMGVLSVGRGNDFAYSMGIPSTYEAGCNALIKGETRKIDIGKVTGGLYPEGRYFGNGIGIGFDAVVGFEAVKMKQLKGFSSYIAGALKTMIFHFDSPELQVELDSSTITNRFLMVSIMNGIRLGGGFFMTPDSQSEDGHFDLCLVKKVNRMQALGLIMQFTHGTQGSHPAVTFARSKKLKVTALQGSIPAHADGETICTKGDQLSIEIIPQSIDLVYAKSK